MLNVTSCIHMKHYFFTFFFSFNLVQQSNHYHSFSEWKLRTQTLIEMTNTALDSPAIGARWPD